MNRFLNGVALLGWCAAAQVHAQGAVADAYSPLIEWRQASGYEVTPIHVALLPNGSLFLINNFNFFENPGTNLTAPGFEPEYAFLMQPTPLDSPLPASVLIERLASPPALRPLFDARTNSMRFKSLNCSGHSLMADGNLFFASGPEAGVDLNLYASGRLLESLTVDGIAESFIYHPDSSTWTQNPNTVIAGPETGAPRRWYATVTRLADSRMLVTGGYEKVYPRLAYNPSVEVFDPAGNSWSAVSGTGSTPAGMENPDYTHAFQFPYAFGPNIVLMIGGSGEPLFLFLNGQNAYWQHSRKFRPGAKEYIDASAPAKVFPNVGSSSALLPIRLPEDSWGYSSGSVLTVGGDHDTPMEEHIDVYDPDANAWRPSIRMSGRRHHPATVNLPDGRILILAGFDDRSPVSRVGYAEYVDPRNGFALSRGNAHMPETRAYHAVAVLLPDGRVLLGSGNIGGADARERTDFRYYYPDYMFKARPRIESAEETLKVGGQAFITVPHKTRIREAALVGLGSMTHSFDMNQRHVQVRVIDPRLTLRLTAGAWVPVGPEQCLDDADACRDLHVVEAPETAEIAPPGHYMLFILDENRVPSIGKMVKLEPRPAPVISRLPPPQAP